MKLLVTGASGLLGLNLCWLVSDPQRRLPSHLDGLEVIGQAYSHRLENAPFPVFTTDLSQPGEARRLLEETHPDGVIHCAAIANIDTCEANPELARRVNADLPGELAGMCAQRGIRFVQISTDAVFDGSRGDYREEDLPNPINTYAASKLAGECSVAQANPRAIIARVNFYGWSLSGQRSLAEFFYNRLSTGQEAPGFRDVYFCPLQVNDLAELLLEMVENGLSGLYHVVSPVALTKEAFGRRIAQRFGYDERLIHSVSFQEGGLRAARSPQLTLRSDKLAQALGHDLPGLDHGLDRLYNELHSGLVDQYRGLTA